ncbi:MAG: hypothetical protein MJ250_03455 [Alphaproteobacteria bacterium]|nr:hypothetical protein [Alphaproteobacteria bacterium]
MKKNALFFLIPFLFSCSTTSVYLENPDVISEDENTLRQNVDDYMTYLKIKNQKGPFDKDFILLSKRVIKKMVKDEIFSQNGVRKRIALRDVLNQTSFSDLRPAIIHEAIEHDLMHSRQVWMTDGSEPYDYVIDVELSEIEQSFDKNADKKAIGCMIVLFDLKNDEPIKEWFDILKRDKNSDSWY